MLQFTCEDKRINEAFRIAMGDIYGNIVSYAGGLLTQPKDCVLAGLGYDTPWTRDAAINVGNCVGLMEPEVARQTLLAVLEKLPDGRTIIGDQYWDRMIWADGAYRYYLYTNDSEFLPLACEAVENTLDLLTIEEFDETDGLYRGPAVYGDGIAAYGDRYTAAGSSCILSWDTRHNPNPDFKGRGIPMKALSTNCVYYRSMVLLDTMHRLAGVSAQNDYAERAQRLKEAIQQAFWDEERGTYRYYLDPWEKNEAQEGMGISLAILYGVADERQTQRILQTAFVSPQGIPCVWPPFDRYIRPMESGSHTDYTHVGRHSGAVWPHIQGYFARACRQGGQLEMAVKEIFGMAEKAVRDKQFAELYHPFSGEIYGGLQESGEDLSKIVLWESCPRQTWSATAFISTVLFVLAGVQIGDRLEVRQPLTSMVGEMQISGLRYRGASWNLHIGKEGVEINQESSQA